MRWYSEIDGERTRKLSMKAENTSGDDHQMHSWKAATCCTVIRLGSSQQKAGLDFAPEASPRPNVKKNSQTDGANIGNSDGKPRNVRVEPLMREGAVARPMHSLNVGDEL